MRRIRGPHLRLVRRSRANPSTCSHLRSRTGAMLRATTLFYTGTITRVGTGAPTRVKTGTKAGRPPRVGTPPRVATGTQAGAQAGAPPRVTNGAAPDGKPPTSSSSCSSSNRRMRPSWFASAVVGGFEQLVRSCRIVGRFEQLVRSCRSRRLISFGCVPAEATFGNSSCGGCTPPDGHVSVLVRVQKESYY